MYSEELNIEAAHQTLVCGIRKFFSGSGISKAILGLSGGIDSAVVAALATEALGKENVHGFMMPSEFSTLHSIQDAVDLAESLDIRYNVIPIGKIYNKFMKELQPVFGVNNQWNVAEENLQARIRGTLLMAYSNKFNALALNTSNKSELSVGYGTLYGDLAGAVMVIADIFKTEGCELAEFINRERRIIPQSTITKAPSAELRQGQKDSDSLPDYSLLDYILHSLNEGGKSPEKLLEEGVDKDILNKVTDLMGKARFKLMQVPPVIKVSSKPLVEKSKWIC